MKKEFIEKIARVQKELKAPKSNKNTFGGYNYRSAEDILEAVKPLLVAEGLFMSLSDEVVMVGTRIYVKATVKVTDGNSEVETSAFAREAETKKGMDDSQITGTASSYARKYALNGMFCIDDTKDADTNEHRKTIETSPADDMTPDPAYIENLEKKHDICIKCKKPLPETVPFKDGKTWTGREFAKAYGGKCPKCIKEENKEKNGDAK